MLLTLRGPSGPVRTLLLGFVIQDLVQVPGRLLESEQATKDIKDFLRRDHRSPNGIAENKPSRQLSTAFDRVRKGLVEANEMLRILKHANFVL